MANDDSNNIGGKVGLDITDFKANVAELNRQIRVVESGFKAAAAGMDDWGKSEEGLQTRINSLNQVTDLQKQKIANLTEQYKKTVQAKGENSKESQNLQVRINNETAALNKNLKELSSTSEALKNFGKETGEASKNTEDLNKKADETGNKFKEMSSTLLKVTGIAAIGKMAVDSAKSILGFSNDTTKALSDIQSKTGYTDETMKGMHDTLLAIYNDNFGENLNDIAGAMSTIGQQTSASGDELKSLTEDALLLRDRFDFDVNESIRSANMLIQQFGMTGDKAYSLIAQGAQRGLDKNGDLLDSVNEYSVHFKQMGFSAEEMFNIMVNGAASGTFSVDKLGDAVKEFGIRTKDGSKGTTEAFQQLGLDVDQLSADFAAGGEKGKAAFMTVNKALMEMQDPLSQNQIGTALWGTMWEDLGVSGIKALTDTRGEISLTGDALKDLNNLKNLDFGASLQGFKRQLITNIAEPIGQEITPKINNMISDLKNFDATAIVNGFGWIVDNANNIVAGIVSIGAGMATWNVVSTVTGVVTAIKDMQKAEEGLTIAQAALNLVMESNLIGIAITAVAALVAGIIYLWNTNEGFRNAIIGAWTTVKTAIVGTVTSIINFVTNNWQQLLLFLVNPIAGALALLYNLNPQFKAWVDGLKTTLVNFFTVTIPTAFNNFITFIAQLPSKIGSFFAQLPTIIGNFLTLAINAISAWGSNLITWVATTIPQVIANVGTFFSELPGKIGYALGFTLGTLVKWGIDIVNWGITTIPQIISSIGNFFMQLPTTIGNIFTNALTTIQQWGVNVINWIVVNVPIIINNIITFFSSLPGQLWNVFLSALNYIWQWGTNVLSWAATTIPRIVGNVITFFSNLPGQLWDVLTSAINNVIRWGANILSWAASTLPSVVSNIVSFFTSLPGSLLDIGVNLVKGLGEGIANTATWIGDKITEFCSSVVKGFKDALGIHSPSTIMHDEVGIMVGKGLGGGIDDSQGGVLESAKNLAQKVIDKFKEIFGIHSPSRKMYELAKFVTQGFLNGLSSTDIGAFITKWIGDVESIANGGLGSALGKLLAPILDGSDFSKIGSFIQGILKNGLSFFSGSNVSGDLAEWITTAMSLTGVSGDWFGPLSQIIEHESSGNPMDINLWDSNAAAGHPSKGLMQLIDENMEDYHLPGLDNIWDPVSNIVAGIRYILDRYGNVYNVPGIRALTQGRPYVGYATGTGNAKAGIAEVAENGMELVVGRQLRNFKGGEVVFNNKDTLNLLNGGDGSIANTGKQLGINLGENVANGIENSINLVKDVAKRLTGAIKDSFQSSKVEESLSDFKWLDNFKQELANGLKDNDVYIKNSPLKLGTITANSVMPERDLREKYFKAYNEGTMTTEKALIDLDTAIKRLEVSTGNYEIDTRNLLGVMTNESTEISILTQEYNKLGQQHGYNSKEAIDVLKKIQDLRTAYQQTGEKIKESTLKNINEITSKVKEALKERYQSEQKDAENRIKLEADTKTKMLQSQLNALNAQSTQMDIQNNNEDDSEKEAELRRQLSMHYGAAKKAELQEQLNNLIKTRNRRHAKESLDAQKQALQNQINQVKENSDEMIKNVDAFYAAKLNTASINAEAEKMVMQNSQSQIIAMLNSYGKDYELAGQSLGDRLVNGLKISLEGIPNLLNGIASQINGLGAGLNNLNTVASTGTTNSTIIQNFNQQQATLGEPIVLVSKTYLDGKQIAETTAPYNNKIQGANLALNGRGL